MKKAGAHWHASPAMGYVLMQHKSIISTSGDQDAGQIAVDFLREFDPDGWHNLVELHPEDSKFSRGQTFPPNSWDSMAQWIRERDGLRNLYFSVNEPIANAPDGKLAKDEIASIRAFHCDIDPEGGRAELEQERARLLDLAANQLRSQCPPTFALDTGGGIQLFWKLVQKLPITETKQVEQQNSSIARALSGDRAGNIDRIMRLPGTLNLPTATKLAKGRTARRARLLHDVLAGWRYTPEQIAQGFPIGTQDALAKYDLTDDETDKQKIEIAALILELDISSVYSAAKYEDLSCELREKFELACGNDPNLSQLWHTGARDALARSKTKPDDFTGSRYRFNLAQRLHKARNFSPEEFGQLLYVWDYGIQQGDDIEAKITPREIARNWVRSKPNRVDLDPADWLTVFDDEPEQLASSPFDRQPQSWAEPIDIFDHAVPTDLDEPPAGCLPGVIERWARSEARRKGVSMAFASMAALATVGSAIGATIRIQVRQHDTSFLEPAALWVALVARPGSAKSAIISSALKPMREVDLEWMSADTKKFSAWERQPKNQRSPTPPTIRRLTMDDVTAERQVMIHAANPRGVMRATDELAGILESFGAYKKAGGGDRAMILRTFDGDSMSVSRVSSGDRFAESALMGILAGTQPGKMQDVADGLQADGLLQRFLFVMEGSSAEPIDEAPDKVAAAEYREAVRECISQPYSREPARVCASDDAHRLLSSFLRDARKLGGLPNLSDGWAGHIGKLEKFAARIALIFHVLHCIEQDRDTLGVGLGFYLQHANEISVSTMEKAVRFCRFMLRHSLAFYQTFIPSDQSPSDTMQVAGRILAMTGSERVKRADIYRNIRQLRGPENKWKLRKSMEELTAYGWLRPVGSDVDPAEWETNPIIYERFAKRAEWERGNREAQRIRIEEASALRRKMLENENA